MPNKRIVIIGLDGVPYRLIQEFTQNNTMPNFYKLIKSGIFRQMKSSIPEISSVAWSSIITGVNPAEHGIFGFTDIAPNSYRTVFPNFSSLKSPAFWHQNETKRSIIINVPSTYPAKRLNGVLISGFVALNLEKAIYPQSLIPKLRSMDYRIDVDYERANESANFFFTDLNRTLRARIAAYRYLWQNENWDNFMLVFTGTDRLMHFFWNTYEDTNHHYHSAFLDYFHQIDEIIGEIVTNMQDNDAIILLSDHGFEKLDKDIYLNFILKQEGILHFENEQTSNLNNITKNTKAFVLDPSRIYIHLKDKYPKGFVEPREREVLLRNLEDIFNSFSLDNKKVIKRCYRKEELYHGPFMSLAPDMVLLANKGFNLRGSLNPAELWGRGNLTGKHTQHDAFLLIGGSFDRISVSDDPCVTDIVSIMRRL